MPSTQSGTRAPNRPWPICTPCSRCTPRPRTREKASPPSWRSGRLAGPAGRVAAMADDPPLHDWKPHVEELTARRSRALGMGGPDLIERQRAAGKLPVRERIALLLDP